MSGEVHNTQLSVEELAHAFEEEAGPVDLSPYAAEDWLNLAIYWCMAFCVFLQFFTRYVLNNSYAWTEEIAINCLIVVVFLGAAMCTRLSRHIRVDFIYRLLPSKPARWLALAVDLLSIGFYGYMTWLMWRYVSIVGRERMVTVDLPRGIVFYAVLAAFVLMLARAVQVFVGDIRHKRSILEREAAAGPSGV
ncbi:TRAP transporter small permease [Kumtagia ephedrae]|jgi:TRAP-type C4-dicarboxylate transport system permease small subunit|uniref:TRAP transporter small permease protein n=1 Tax=Kumtagia ephedrae TaxID=2116701 RepID=A0A2P7S7G9_9HYPH|nr:TRAP transporter small permease [Mesorhizobium ephedrae]PSJ58400.1 TRAP transporter permease DctQ [Mesorhizobium ephedrae]